MGMVPISNQGYRPIFDPNLKNLRKLYLEKIYKLVIFGGFDQIRGTFSNVFFALFCAFILAQNTFFSA